ncbi:hypothetical protein [Microbacterium sp.]|uniref:hypothetical protein n=1 Tax=Microbacterium sp. TaxID=51671 RepID=UPI00281111A0|nr:hypothetical protein [Microbacterium sp.]
MAARGSRQRAKTEAERARLYAARAKWHETQVRRRHRDTMIAVIAGALVVIGAVVSQTLHAQITAPAPSPSPSAPASDTPAPETPTPTLTNPPLDSPTPVPTQTPGE